MRSLDRKLLRDIRQTKGLLFAITSVIAVGVTCFVTLRSSYENLSLAMDDYYRQCRMADFWIELKKIPVSEVESLERYSGVAELESRIQFYATVDLPDSREPINGLVISLPDDRRPSLNDILINRGEYFSEERRNQVIVNEQFANENSIHPGQTIQLLLNDRRESVYVVGTASSSEFSYMLGPGSLLPDPSSFGVFYVKQSFAEEVYDFSGAANMIAGKLSPGHPRDVETMLIQMEDELVDYGVLTSYPLKRQTSHSFLDNEISGLESIATVMPAIFMVVAALILNVLVSRLVRQQRTMIGTMKALGYESSAIFVHFLKLGLIVGIAGGLLGSLCGFLLSMSMTSIYSEYFEFPNLQSGFHLYTHAIGLGASMVCAALGSLWGARTAIRMQPAEAMRPSPPARGGQIWLERFPVVWTRLRSPWKLALRNVFRNPLRSGMTIFSTMMGAGLLVAGFNLYESQGYMIDFQFQRINRADLELSFQETQDREVLAELQRLPGVDRVAPVFDLPCTLIGGHVRERVSIQGLDPNATLTFPRDRRGRPIRMPDSGIVLGRRLASKLGVDVGDQLTLLPSVGRRESIRVRVAALVDSYIGLVAYADLDYLSSILGESSVVSRVQMLTDNDTRHEQQLYARLKEMPQVQSVTDRRDLIQSLNEIVLQTQFVMFAFIVGFAGVIFLGSIVNSMMISLAERMREVATLRAIGYTDWQVGGAFLRESFAMAAIGTILGFPTGFAIVNVMAVGVNSDISRIPVVVAIWGIWLTLILALMYVGMAHMVVQRAIFRVNVIESLNVKE